MEEKELEETLPSQEEELEYASFSYVDAEGNFHESFGFYVPDQEDKTQEERIKEMQEIIKNAE